MTYDIIKTNKTTLTKLDNGIVDDETLSGINLIGYLIPNYGALQSDNFVHLAENFANYEFPDNPINGMICYIYNPNVAKIGTDGDLYLCVNATSTDVDTRWKKLPIVKISSNEPSGVFKTGDMWYNTDKHSFNMYDSTENKWISIGPNDYNSSEIIIKSSNTSGDIEIIDFSDMERNGYSYLISIYVVGKEIGLNNLYVDRCATAGWKIQLLINSYQIDSQQYSDVEIVGLPDYELIGTTDSSWNVLASIKNKKLILTTKGTGYNENNPIKWQVKADILKVK